MRRKVIQLANKTLVISLPIKWVENLGIKKKDELEILESGRDLLIRGEKDSTKQIEINTEGMDNKFVKNLLLVLNSLGYDEITLNYENPKIIPVIHELLNRFTGFVIMKQTDDKCVLKNVSKEAEEELDNIIERAFLVTLSLSESTIDLIKKKKFASLRNLRVLESTNNQLTSICGRILVKKGYKEPEKTCFMYVIIWNLERIADFYRYLCNYLSFKKEKISLRSSTLKLLEMLHSILLFYYNLFKNLDMQKIVKLFEKKEKIGELVEEDLFKKGGIDDIVVGHYIMDILTFILDSSTLLLAVSPIEKAK